MREHAHRRGLRVVLGRSVCAMALLLGMPMIAAAADTPTASAAEADKAGVGSPFELTFWQSVSASNDVAQYDAYVARYPKGTFVTLAKVKIAALMAQQAGAPAPVVAPPPGTEPAVGTAPLPAPAPPAPPAPVAISTAAAVAATPAEPALPAPTATSPSVPPAPLPPAPIAPAPISPTVAAPAAAALPPADPVSSPSGVRPYSAPAAVRAALPLKPVLAHVDLLQLPPGFCSMTSRDDFYTQVFRPAADTAANNNQKANAYLASVREQFDRYDKVNDVTGANITAQEAAAYRDIAGEAYRISRDFGAKYEALMKLPIGGCR